VLVVPPALEAPPVLDAPPVCDAPPLPVAPPLPTGALSVEHTFALHTERSPTPGAGHGVQSVGEHPTVGVGETHTPPHRLSPSPHPGGDESGTSTDASSYPSDGDDTESSCSPCAQAATRSAARMGQLRARATPLEVDCRAYAMIWTKLRFTFVDPPNHQRGGQFRSTPPARNASYRGEKLACESTSATVIENARCVSLRDE
jgi:hypothetical protein